MSLGLAQNYDINMMSFPCHTLDWGDICLSEPLLFLSEDKTHSDFHYRLNVAHLKSTCFIFGFQCFFVCNTIMFCSDITL